MAADPSTYSDEPTLFGFPLNRIVSFAGPHISWLAGVFATWLIAHLHFLATFHVGQSDAAKVIANVGVFVTVTAVTWLGHQKWLDGFQVWAYGKNASGSLPAGVDPNGPFNAPPSGDYTPGEFGDTGDPVAPPGVTGQG